MSNDGLSEIAAAVVATNEGAQQTEEPKPRKPRSPSKFVLVRVEATPEGDALYVTKCWGATDKKLMANALMCGDGAYEVHYIRRAFKVSTKQKTVIE